MTRKCLGNFIMALLVFFVLMFTMSFVSCAPPTLEKDTPKTVTTIYPVYDMARQIAGQRVEVICLMNPGESPHTFEFTPERIKKLEGAEIAIKVGLGLDDWLDNTLKSLDSNISIYDIHKGIEFMEGECSHDHGSDHHDTNHHHGQANPHIWLSLENAKIIVENIYHILSENYPEYDNYFVENKQHYLEEIKDLDAAFKQEAQGFSKKKFIAHHDAWVYLAHDLGIEQVMSVEPFPGKEPTPAYIIQLQKTVDQYNIETVFIEPQLSPDVVNFLTQDMALEVRTLDPLGGTDETETYLELMTYNFEQIKGALK